MTTIAFVLIAVIWIGGAIALRRKRIESLDGLHELALRASALDKRASAEFAEMDDATFAPAARQTRSMTRINSQAEVFEAVIRTLSTKKPSHKAPRPVWATQLVFMRSSPARLQTTLIHRVGSSSSGSYVMALTVKSQKKNDSWESAASTANIPSYRKPLKKPAHALAQA